ncbi:chorismate synthase [Alkalibacterium pelagium]|uniref:Chorismate synthase n=1 Tax=Alkalibacterium pelagium TaxID=426702 RepID=A0A1H7KDG7_9LACT|nr:chorismate synthase [Alkalibacterium pelagium]GEN50791.1 chorismate synthase [Alkalibacterium pelagium]SEK84560.1 chorismate synthase [Alkalibacterium pelagium]
MSGIWGKQLELSLFGESHGDAIGITINGLPPGFEIDMEEVQFEMARRAPGSSDLTTPRKEKDLPEILSGFLDGKTTGAPLTAIIRNTNTRSKDYSLLKDVMRPGQADYPGRMRYKGHNDHRGSGHFSGRITAPIVFAGAICQQWLKQKGVTVSSHIQSIGHIEDQRFADQKEVTHEQAEAFKKDQLPLFDGEKKEAIRDLILEAKEEGDSVGGVVETFVLGIPAGYGNPFFDSVESTLAHLVFSVPAIKGIEFGTGFDITRMKGSEANDEYYYDENGQVKTRSNNNGGIIGGITYGMPIVFRSAVKPPASIKKKQQTINVREGKAAELEVEGRHDPCIVPRVLPVLEAVTAIALTDLILGGN